MDQLQRRICQTPANFRSLLPAITPRRKERPECFLLNLPVEVLGFINDYLPFRSQVYIRLTCSTMYNSLKSPVHTREEKLECLALIYRDRPDCWVAEEWPLVRDVVYSDLPRPPKGRPIFQDLPYYADEIYLFERNALMVEHKHVQLAIKYSELESRNLWQAIYLRLLLKPFKTVFRPRFRPGPLCSAKETCSFQWCPKVVSGRYLTFTQRRFTNNWEDKPVEMHRLAPFGSCMHQFTDPERFGHFLQRQRLYGSQMKRQSKQRQRFRLHPECSDPFFECLQNAYNTHGVWFDGACPWCLTEFSMRVQSGELVVNTWRDLGGCGSPLNPDWRSHTYYVDTGTEDVIERCPWEIRSRYSGDERIGIWAKTMRLVTYVTSKVYIAMPSC
ncbi:hypothetical protein SNK05_001890 [Fusarium graminearum]